MNALTTGQVAKVLIVSDDQFMVETVVAALPTGVFRIAMATSGFDAGYQIAGFHPDALIVDFSIGYTEALQICQNLRRNAKFSEVIIVALLSQKPTPAILLDFGKVRITEFFLKPPLVRFLSMRLHALIGTKKDLV